MKLASWMGFTVALNIFITSGTPVCYMMESNGKCESVGIIYFPSLVNF